MPKHLALCLAVALAPALAGADTVSQRNGTDLFLSGTSALPEVNTTGDVFAAGQSVVLKGSAGGDTHAAGFDVSVEAPVSGDLYTAGATVAVLAPVAQDLTAMGLNLRTSSLATVAGNARMLGNTVVIDGPISGALTVTAAELALNTTVGGDVLMVAGTAHFGPEAHILGRLTYLAEAPIAVPANVIPADRVIFQKSTVSQTLTDIGTAWQDGLPAAPPARAVLGGFLMVMAFLVAVGAVMLATAPVWSDRVRRTVDTRPGPCLLAGVFGLSALFGLVPVAVMTIIGIPLLPLVLAAILLGWILGYLVGVQSISLRLAHAFGIGDALGLPGKVLVLALGLLIAALMNFVPVLGWLLNFFLLLLGTGAIVLVLVRSPIAAPPTAA